MASNMQNFNSYFGGGGGGSQGNIAFGGGGGGMPSFSQFNQWSQQMGQRPSNYQVGQNAPVDSNAPYRDVYGPQGALANGATLGNPYGMQQSAQSPYSWNGSGWTQQGQGIARGEPQQGRAQASKNQFSAQQGGRADPPQQQPPRSQWGSRPNVLPGRGDPYQFPGGPGQISTKPGYGMPQPWTGGQAPQPGPRPRPQVNDVVPQNFAPGQQQYTGPAISPMNNRPGRGIGPGGPTRFVPGFQPNASQGFGRGTMTPNQQQNPYRMY